MSRRRKGEIFAISSTTYSEIDGERGVDFVQIKREVGKQVVGLLPPELHHLCRPLPGTTPRAYALYIPHKAFTMEEFERLVFRGPAQLPHGRAQIIARVLMMNEDEFRGALAFEELK